MKDFRVEASSDGINFHQILAGSISGSRLNTLTNFEVSPETTMFLRLIADSNQSKNAVSYVNIAEFSVSGTEYLENDIHEPDSLKELSSLVDIKGSSQSHNINLPGDCDWIKFYGEIGFDYLINVDPFGADTNLIVDIYSSSGSTALASFQVFSGDNKFIIWSPDFSGNYYLKICHTDPVFYSLETGYSIWINERIESDLNYFIFLPVVYSSDAGH